MPNAFGLLAASREQNKLHQDSTAYIAMLDDPKRDEYQKPHEVITALKLKEGEVIADIGAGSGYFTFRLARHVGHTGRAYAVDVSPKMIVHLNRRLRDLNVKNVVSILAAPDDPLLADASVDRFFVDFDAAFAENFAKLADCLLGIEARIERRSRQPRQPDGMRFLSLEAEPGSTFRRGVSDHRRAERFQSQATTRAAT